MWVWVESEAEREGVVVAVSHLWLICTHLSLVVIIAVGVIARLEDLCTCLSGWERSTPSHVLCHIRLVSAFTTFFCGLLPAAQAGVERNIQYIHIKHGIEVSTEKAGQVRTTNSVSRHLQFPAQQDTTIRSGYP